jgi:UDP-N-acetylenolpyruvoylglucosamine reductase
MEGRELFIVNIDFDATESDVRNLLAEVYQTVASD